MARRGAARVRDGGGASAAWRAAADSARSGNADTESESESDWQSEEWIDEGVVRDEAEGAVRRGGAPRRSRREADGGARRQSSSRRRVGADDHEKVDRDLAGAVGKGRVERFEERLDAASQAFRRGRYDEARTLLRPLAEGAPRAESVRELYGLTLYRLGRWKAAVKELEAFRTLSDSVDQHPVLADSYRALRRYDQVDELWQELRAASPGAELVAEGRIVAAGALADQGRVDDAIGLLEPAVRPTRRAREHHLRMAYALADLYERAGDLPRARELFQRVAASDPDFVDVESRLHALR